MSVGITHKGTVLLETDRLLLRPLTENDAQKVYDNWTSDEEVSKYMRWDRHKNVEVTINWMKECEEGAKKLTYYDWGIILKDINEPIGSIGAFIDQSEPDRYEVGYALGKRYWGNGYATEALNCVINFLTKEVGIKRYTAQHAHQNPASGAVMKHVGFTYAKDGSYTSFDGMRSFKCKVYYLDSEG